MVTEGSSLGCRWANLVVNLTSGSFVLVGIWEGPNYDDDLEALRDKCRRINGILKEVAAMSLRSLSEFKGRE